MSDATEQIKQGQRAMWTAGDYPEVAQRLEPVAELIVGRVGAGAGLSLLDVATGSGNVALAAARAGAAVTGLDLTPKLLEAARGRALEAGLEVELIEGDAEALPFADGSFDLVTSCFGVMFAPRQRVAAGELVRVARPGATIAVTAWTPAGFVGTTFRTSGRFMPPPPPGFVPPVAWGEEDRVAELFDGTGAELSFERATVAFTGDSAESWLERDERILGPSIMAKAALEPQGRYGELRGELLAHYENANTAGDGGFRVESEYLLTLARLPA